MSMKPSRAYTIQTLQLIADIEAQRQYEKNVPIADVPSELICQWFDDYYHPESEEYRLAFTDEELDTMAEFSKFYDSRVEKLPQTLNEMHQCDTWRQIVEKAQWVLDKLQWDGIDALPTRS